MAQVYSGCGTMIARLPGVQPELDKAAGAILARAKAAAAAHVKSSSYLNSLGVGSIPGKNGVIDREVFAADPAAIPIEFGHISRGKDGATWVPGQRILLSAVYGGK